MKLRFITLLGLLLPCALFAQEDVSGYFDDGGISDPNNAIKIDVLSSAAGEVAFSYERFFTDEFSLEVGAGFALGRGLEPIFIALDTEEFFTDRSGGFKFLLNPRYHAWGTRREGVVYGLNFFVRNLKDVEYENFTTDRSEMFIGLYQGYQYEIGNRMSIEVAAHIGALIIDDFSGNFVTSPDASGSTELNVGFSCKLAYHK